MLCLNFCVLCRRLSEVAAALQPLAAELWQRIAGDAAAHSRLPHKLGLTWRVGYGKQQSKTVQLPSSVCRQMRLLLLPQGLSQGLVVKPGGVNSDGGCVAAGGDSGNPQQQEQEQQQQYGASVSSPQQKTGGQQQEQQQVDAVCQMLVQAFLGIIKAVAPSKQAKVKGSSNAASTGMPRDMQQRQLQQQQDAGSSAAGLHITRLVLAALYADGCL